MSPEQASKIVSLLLNKPFKGKPGATKETIKGMALGLVDLDHGTALSVVDDLVKTEEWFPSVARFRQAHASRVKHAYVYRDNVDEYGPPATPEQIKECLDMCARRLSGRVSDEEFYPWLDALKRRAGLPTSNVVPLRRWP